MPVNQDGVEVNPDGSPITDEQRETSDWTQVVELNQKSKVKPYSVDVMVSNLVPHTIPYLEVYRTDELYFKDYESAFNSVTNSSVTDGVNAGETETGSEGTGTETSSSSSSSSGGGSSSGGSSSGSKSNQKKNKESSGKVRTTKLSNEINSIVKRYYKKSANTTTIANRYLACKTNKLYIASVTTLHSTHLKNIQNVNSLNNAIYNAKHKYS